MGGDVRRDVGNRHGTLVASGFGIHIRPGEAGTEPFVSHQVYKPALPWTTRGSCG